MKQEFRRFKLNYDIIAKHMIDRFIWQIWLFFGLLVAKSGAITIRNIAELFFITASLHKGRHVFAVANIVASFAFWQD